jgi:hypothetical protein
MPLSCGRQDGSHPLVPGRACPLSAPTACWTKATHGAVEGFFLCSWIEKGEVSIGIPLDALSTIFPG